MSIRDHVGILPVIAYLIIQMSFSFGQGFTDSYQYLYVIEVLRGDAPIGQVARPFVWRIWLPLISLPLTAFWEEPYFIPMSIMSGVGAVLWFIAMYFLLREFTTDNRYVLGVLLLLIGTTDVWKWLAVPLTDAWAMFFITAIMLCSKTGKDREAYVLTAVGILARETVFLALIFHILYRRENRMYNTTAAFVIGLYYLIFRYITTGTIAQGLAFVGLSVKSRSGLIQIYTTMAVVVIIFLISLSTTGIKDKRWLLIGLLTTAPIAYLGLFHAAFMTRFLWPMWLAILPPAMEMEQQ